MSQFLLKQTNNPYPNHAERGYLNIFFVKNLLNDKKQPFSCR